MPERRRKTKILRFTQEELTELFNSGEAKLTHSEESRTLRSRERKVWREFLGLGLGPEIAANIPILHRSY